MESEINLYIKEDVRVLVLAAGDHDDHSLKKRWGESLSLSPPISVTKTTDQSVLFFTLFCVI